MRIRFKVFVIFASFIISLGFLPYFGNYNPTSIMAQTIRQPQAATRTLDIIEFIFQPDPIIVATGDTLRWINQDGAPHTVTAQDTALQVFDSGTMNQNDAFEVQLNIPGAYRYICTIHPFMQGQIIVSDEFSEGFYPLILGQ